MDDNSRALPHPNVFARFVNWLAGRPRALVQLGATVVFNSAFLAPWLKAVPCVGFNCYACPAAIFACPIGSLQHFIIIRQVPLYLLGFLGLIGGLAGRLSCGWLCPFGFLQDLLYKIPLPKWRVSNRFARFRYVIFAVLVVAIPFVTLEPWFCKLCPAGALEAGLPLAIIDAEIRALAGVLFAVKMIILAAFLLWMIVTTRPFCRFVCPLGSVYAPFNRISGIRLHLDQAQCRECDICARACPTALYPPTEIDSEGCIRCLECLKVCPHHALGPGPAAPQGA
jgi:ferredoxin-type protein NapH